MVLAQVIDSLQTTLLEDRARVLKPLLIDILPEETGDEQRDSLPRVINRRLEVAIVLPLREKITRTLRERCTDLEQIERNKSGLKSKPQACECSAHLSSSCRFCRLILLNRLSFMLQSTGSKTNTYRRQSGSRLFGSLRRSASGSSRLRC